MRLFLCFKVFIYKGCNSFYFSNFILHTTITKHYSNLSCAYCVQTHIGTLCFTSTNCITQCKKSNKILQTIQTIFLTHRHKYVQGNLICNCFNYCCRYKRSNQKHKVQKIRRKYHVHITTKRNPTKNSSPSTLHRGTTL